MLRSFHFSSYRFGVIWITVETRSAERCTSLVWKHELVHILCSSELISNSSFLKSEADRALSMLNKSQLVFYPIEGDPGHMCVCRVQGSGHKSVGTHQLVSQISFDTWVNSGPGHRGSIQPETLRKEKRKQKWQWHSECDVTHRSIQNLSRAFVIAIFAFWCQGLLHSSVTE